METGTLHIIALCPAYHFQWLYFKAVAEIQTSISHQVLIQ